MLVALLVVVWRVAGRAAGVRLVDWELVDPVVAGAALELNCDYRLQPGAELYSLKWFRDDVEFYRFSPGGEARIAAVTQLMAYCVADAPHTVVFLVPGMELEPGPAGSHTTVLLSGLTREASGLYRCEVSEGPPSFATAARTTNITVLQPPPGPPAIYGLNPLYRPGEEVRLICEAGPAAPAAVLAWRVEGGAGLSDPQITALSPLSLLPDPEATVSRSQLLLLPGSAGLAVECEAVVEPVYRQSARVAVRVGRPNAWRAWLAAASPAPALTSSLLPAFLLALLPALLCAR